jgi:hypothetical protein
MTDNVELKKNLPAAEEPKKEEKGLNEDTYVAGRLLLSSGEGRADGVASPSTRPPDKHWAMC